MEPLSATMRRVSAALSQRDQLAHASPPRLHDSQQAPRINTYALLPHTKICKSGPCYFVIDKAELDNKLKHYRQLVKMLGS